MGTWFKICLYSFAIFLGYSLGYTYAKMNILDSCAGDLAEITDSIPLSQQLARFVDSSIETALRTTKTMEERIEFLNEVDRLAHEPNISRDELNRITAFLIRVLQEDRFTQGQKFPRGWNNFKIRLEAKRILIDLPPEADIEISRALLSNIEVVPSDYFHRSLIRWGLTVGSLFYHLDWIGHFYRPYPYHSILPIQAPRPIELLLFQIIQERKDLSHFSPVLEVLGQFHPSSKIRRQAQVVLNLAEQSSFFSDDRTTSLEIDRLAHEAGLSTHRRRRENERLRLRKLSEFRVY